MDMTYENNLVRLCGQLGGRPVFSHASRSEEFFSFPLEVARLSGNVDRIPLLVRKSQLGLVEAAEAERLSVTGELRSFNNRRGEGARLVITVLVRELAFSGPEAEDDNRVELSGTLCKAPNFRTTPMGRDICDLMLAVNRRYGRSDYLPCICWGLKAREASGWEVGTRLHLSGRIQSRSYIKLTDSGPAEKTAYEVSAAEVEVLSDSFCRRP